jgi:hypothetical protein
LGIGPGATVVTVSHTAVATVAAIEMVGATPLLLDIDPDTYTMDPDELVAVLEDPPPGLPPIRAVIPCTSTARPCDLGPMLEAARRHGVAVIEDLQPGAWRDARRAGHRHARRRLLLLAVPDRRTSARSAMAACWRPDDAALGRPHRRDPAIWLEGALHQRRGSA